MTTFISPEVVVQEISVGATISNPAANAAGFVGEFQTGPCFELTTISSASAYEQIFGRPDGNNYKHYFTGYNVFSYANNLQVVRTIGGTSLNSGIAFKQIDASPTTPTQVNITRLNEADTPTVSFGADDKLHFYYKYPGTYGNNFKVGVVNYEDFNTNTFTVGTVVGTFQVGEQITGDITGAKGTIVAVYPTGLKVNNIFGTFSPTEDITGTTSGATATVSVISDLAEVTAGVTFTSLFTYSVLEGQVGIVILDSSDNVLETFIASLTPGDTDSAGTVIYIEDYLEASSQYVYAYDNTTQTNTVATTSSTTLLGGTTVAPTDSEIQTAWNEFGTSENSDAWVLMVGGYNENTTIKKYVIQTIAEGREDIFVVCGPKQTSVVGISTETSTLNSLLEDKVDDLGVVTSYYGYFANYKFQRDSFNNTNRWIPLDGDIAGLILQTAENVSVAQFGWGYNYGIIKNILKLAWNPSKPSRDELWKVQANSVIRDGSSTIVIGDQTGLNINNIFNQIGNRLLFNFIKRGLIPFAKTTVIAEKNNTLTQRRFKNSAESFLDQFPNDIEEYLVISDDTVNTDAVKARGEFVASIYIKPFSSIRYVLLQLFGLASDVSIDEIVSDNTGT